MGRKLQHPREVYLLATRIAVAKKNQGFTLESLASATGVDRSQISRFTTGKFRTVSTNLQIICKFLGVAPDVPTERGRELPTHLTEIIEKSWAGSSGKKQHSLETALIAVATAFLESGSSNA